MKSHTYFQTLWLAALLILPFSPLQAAGTDTIMQNIDGNKQSLSDYLGKGKWVMFNIWGPKCPPCLEEVSELTAFQDAHQDKDAIVVSMALDFPSFGFAKKEQVATFMDDYFINFPVFLGDADLSQKVTGRPLYGTPTTYLYDPSGKLAAARIGGVTQKMMENYMQRYVAKQ